jgi:hypothetical protein
VRASTGTCDGQNLTLPFTDVAGTNIFFCSIAQAYFTGLTNGTTATTYSPGANVTREQMAAFITRTQDSALKRGSRRAAVGEWSIPKRVEELNPTTVGDHPISPCFDGEDIWVPNFGGDTVTRVHASDGRVLGTWTGAVKATSTIAAAGFIYVVGESDPAKIYRINPSFSPGTVTEVASSNVGILPDGITYDGFYIWTANNGGSPGAGTITKYDIVNHFEGTFIGTFNRASGICFDGTSLWVSDSGDDKLYRFNPTTGSVTETIDVGNIPTNSRPAFDGSNIWVPVLDGVSVVSTSTPARIVATLTGNGLDGSNHSAAFDGERVLVTNESNDSVSLWKATSLTPLGTLVLGSTKHPQGVCSDGLHFWITVNGPGAFDHLILRF